MMSQISQGTEVCHQEQKQTPSQIFLEQFFENSQLFRVCNLNLVLVSSSKFEVLTGNSSVQNHVPKLYLHSKYTERFPWDFICNSPHHLWQSCSPVLLQSPNLVTGGGPRAQATLSPGKLERKGSVPKLQGAAGYVRKQLRKLQWREEQENC